MRDENMARVHQVTLLDTGESFACGNKESVLHGMSRLGRRGIPIGCRGGGCGVCKVQVLSGAFHAKAMSRDHVSAEEQAQGQVLACRICPSSDVQLQVLGRLRRWVNGRQPHTDTVSMPTSTVFDRP